MAQSANIGMKAHKIQDENLKKALKAVGILYVEGVRQQLKRDDTYATGSLAESISYKVVDGSVDIAMAKYGKAVEDGSSQAKGLQNKVSTRFINDIMEWMSFKGIGAGKNKKSIANAIARGIKKKGIISRFNGGSKMMDEVYSRLEKKIGEELSSAYLRDLKEQLEKI